MNVNDQWMLERMQQLAASMAASLSQTSQNTETPKTEKGESFQDLMDKAKDQKAEAPKKEEAPQKAEKAENVQKTEGKKVEVTKNADGTETKKVELTAQEAAMVLAGYAKLSQPTEDGTVWMVTVQDENGNPVLPLAELEGDGYAYQGQVLQNDEWTVEPTDELVKALEQLLDKTNDPRSVNDILGKLAFHEDGSPVEAKLEITVKAPEMEQADSEDDSDELDASVTASSQPLFKDVKAAPVKVGENFELDTQQPEMDDKLADAIRFAAQQGLKQIEIKLSPESLGELTVKLTQSADGALQVVLHAANAKAANLLTQHMDGLHAALQGYSQEVRVEVQRGEDSQQAQQQNQQADPNGHNRQQQQQQRREEQHGGSQDFVQRMRLGLFGPEE